MRLPDYAASTIADQATDDVLSLIDMHIAAHPLRYGFGELADDAAEELRQRVRYGIFEVLADQEIPPR